VQVGGTRDGGRHLIAPTDPPHVKTDRQLLVGARRQPRQVRVTVGRQSGGERRAAVTSTIVVSAPSAVGSLVTGDHDRRSGATYSSQVMAGSQSTAGSMRT
jgi:hypothetical protein